MKVIPSLNPKFLNLSLAHFSKNCFFWSNLYKIVVMITSFIEMLELPYFDHMTKSTVLQPCLLKEPLKTQKSRKN